MKRAIRILLFVFSLAFLLTVASGAVSTGTGGLLPSVSVSIGNGEANTDTVKMLIMLTVLALAPSVLIMMTSFTRIIIVFSFVRNALGLQQTPPNQVLVGLALFLTLFIMSPVISDINTNAYTPYAKNEISQDEFLQRAGAPLKNFMLKQTSAEDVNTFLGLAGRDRPDSVDEIGMEIVIPAFITSELKRAFIIGFLLYLPFLLIDMVVASVLMSMGMMMVPPSMVSLPFKIMLFVLVDGWGLIVKTLVTSFH